MERNRRKRSGFSLFTADGLVSAAASPRAVDAPREQLIKQLDDAVKGSKVREVEMAKAAMRHEARHRVGRTAVGMPIARHAPTSCKYGGGAAVQRHQLRLGTSSRRSNTVLPSYN
jgi:hypothetical protein